MNRNEALLQAETIANIINQEADGINQTSIRELPLMSALSFYSAFKECRFEARSIIHEILIFGSLARGNEEVGDIDMMVLDTGFYSRILAPKKRLLVDSGSFFVREKLAQLFEGWFNLNREDPMISAVLEAPVDLHVYALRDIVDPDRRRELSKNHHDPQFFENAFSSILRFNRFTGNFDPISFQDFVEECATICALEETQHLYA